MAGQNSNKGNPASKRMTNAQKKALRARCWANGEARKKARVAAQKQREADNKARRGRGEPTPWEAAKAKRAQRRATKRAA